MPETDQASQFMIALEPFYKVAYEKGEKAPPIFKIFSNKHDVTPSIKMNGYAAPLKESTNEHMLNTSHASAIHDITENAVSYNKHSNGNVEATELLSNGDVNGIKPDPCDKDGKNYLLTY